MVSDPRATVDLALRISTQGSLGRSPYCPETRTRPSLMLIVITYHFCVVIVEKTYDMFIKISTVLNFNKHFTKKDL